MITIDHVVIAVSDWDHSSSFYRDPDGTLLEFIVYDG